MSRYNDFDPLSVLRVDDLPVQPDPDFAARLRQRLESAVALPNRTEGVIMSGTAEILDELTATNAPEQAGYTVPRSAAVPYLQIARARDAIDWYVDAFGATVVGEPIIMDDGRVGHAELAIAGGVLYLADEFPELGLKAPTSGFTSVSLMLHVADTDSALERAHDCGADVVMEAEENYGSRRATIVDPFGHRWMLSGPVTVAVTRILPGDVGYASLWTPSAERAAAFYGQVLGWSYDENSHQVTNLRHRLGIFSTDGPTTLFCCYAVADLHAARQAIVAAGGQPGEIRQVDNAAVLDATDATGAAFAVYEAGDDEARPELNFGGPGELSYITYETSDSAAFRDFYAAALGWTYTGGEMEGGWEVESAHPMSGVAGGSATRSTVPMWTVPDIESAVGRVREAGGGVIQEPSQRPYGIMAECTDDQGGRFYLGEF